MLEERGAGVLSLGELGNSLLHEDRESRGIAERESQAGTRSRSQGENRTDF